MVFFDIKDDAACVDFYNNICSVLYIADCLRSMGTELGVFYNANINANNQRWIKYFVKCNDMASEKYDNISTVIRAFKDVMLEEKIKGDNLMLFITTSYYDALYLLNNGINSCYISHYNHAAIIGPEIVNVVYKSWARDQNLVSDAVKTPKKKMSYAFDPYKGWVKQVHCSKDDYNHKLEGARVELSGEHAFRAYTSSDNDIDSLESVC